MQAKIKQTKERKLDLSSVGLRRHLEVTTNDLQELLATHKPVAPQATPTITSLPARRDFKVKDDGSAAASTAPTDAAASNKAAVEAALMKTEEDKFAPIEAEPGMLMWRSDRPLPPLLAGLVSSIRVLFNIKKEVANFGVTLWTPRDEKKYATKTYTIPAAGVNVGARVVLAVGGTECLKSTVPGGASGHVELKANEAFMTPIAYATAVTYTFDNRTSFTHGAKKGFRSKSVRKTPSNVYVIVFDGLSDVKVLTEHIKSEAALLSGNDAKLSAEIEQRMAGIIPSAVDKVIEQTAAAPAQSASTATQAAAPASALGAAGAAVPSTAEVAVAMPSLPPDAKIVDEIAARAETGVVSGAAAIKAASAAKPSGKPLTGKQRRAAARAARTETPAKPVETATATPVTVSAAAEAPAKETVKPDIVCEEVCMADGTCSH